MQTLDKQPLSYDAHRLYAAVESLLSEKPLPTSLLYEIAHNAVPPPPWRNAAYELAARRLLAVRISDGGAEQLCWYAALYKKDWWVQHHINPFHNTFTDWVDFTWDSWATALSTLSVETENLENLNHALLIALRKGWVVTAKNGTRIKTASNTDGN